MHESSESRTTAETSKTNHWRGIDDIYRLDFAIRKSVRYHMKRKRFFERLHYISIFLTAFSSSAAFAALLSEESNHKIALWLIAFIAVISFLDLAVDFSGKGALYDGLQKRFSDLLAKIIRTEITPQKLKELEIERILIEQDEPTPLKALDILCHNEEVVAQNNGCLYRIGWLRLRFIDFISFDGWNPKPIEK